MDVITYRDYCLSLPFTEETTPFDETTLVYKVGGKIYTLADMVDFRWVNVKCEPARALELRERYAEITPGFHMNKMHWNSVRVDGDLPDSFIRTMIRDSYLLIVYSLPRMRREEILSAIEASGLAR